MVFPEWGKIDDFWPDPFLSSKKPQFYANFSKKTCKSRKKIPIGPVEKKSFLPAGKESSTGADTGPDRSVAGTGYNSDQKEKDLVWFFSFFKLIVLVGKMFYLFYHDEVW
jgi:hypothetical protein